MQDWQKEILYNEGFMERPSAETNTPTKMIKVIRTPKEKFQVTEELIGKYINQVLFSDVAPVGKIVGIKGKTKVLIQPIVSGPNKRKDEMNFEAGGFCGTFTNQHIQCYDFFEEGEVYESAISHTKMKNNFWRIGESPRKFYDYNF